MQRAGRVLMLAVLVLAVAPAVMAHAQEPHTGQSGQDTLQRMGIAGPSCSSDADCGACSTCTSGSCEYQCAADETCNSGTCECASECCSDADCGADETCSSGSCVCDSECCSDSACQDGYYCNSNGVCEESCGSCPAGEGYYCTGEKEITGCYDWDDDGCIDEISTWGYCGEYSSCVEDTAGDAHCETDNYAPNPSFSFSPSSPGPGQEVTFDASASSDQDGSIVSYEWDWTKDGSYDSTGVTATHTYDSLGDYQVKLRVTDDGTSDAGSRAAATTKTVTVEDLTPPTTTSNAPMGWHGSPQTISLSCNDVGGSGCSITEYCVDQSDSCTPSTQGSQVTVEDHGVNYIRFRSQDGAGNLETTRSVTVRIDLRTPSFGCDDCIEPRQNTVGLLTELSPSVTDPDSGVDSVRLCADRDCEQVLCDSGSCQYTANEPRRYDVFVEATDAVGNTGVRLLGRMQFLLQLGSFCESDQACLSGDCRDNVCVPGQLPPVVVIR